MKIVVADSPGKFQTWYLLSAGLKDCQTVPCDFIQHLYA
jgi:hypothetical protein